MIKKEQKLSLDEAIELARKIDKWDLSLKCGDTLIYEGIVKERPSEISLNILVGRSKKLFRGLQYRISVHSSSNNLADYTSSKVKEIYNMAEENYERNKLTTMQKELKQARRLL